MAEVPSPSCPTHCNGASTTPNVGLRYLLLISRRPRQSVAGAQPSNLADVYNIKTFFLCSPTFFCALIIPGQEFPEKPAIITITATEQANAKGNTLLASENFSLQKASPHRHLSPEDSCIQPRTHPSSLLLQHATSASAMFFQQGHTHNHTQFLKSAPFPPSSTFHRACFIQVKNNPLLLDNIFHKSLVQHLECTAQNDILGPLIAMYHKDQEMPSSLGT